MTTATTPRTMAAPAPLEIPGPVAHVPSLDTLRRLTDVPDRRVVFRDVDWSFYEQLVDSIPEGNDIHVDYDGRDLEVMAKGRKHERINRRLDLLVVIIADEWNIRFTGLSETTWKRPAISRGLESDNAYYFLPEKLAQDAAASDRGSDDIADYPNPDLAIEVDISRPQVDRAGIYAALDVAEVWRFDDGSLIIERLTRRWDVRGRRFQRIPAHPCRGIAASDPGRADDRAGLEALGAGLAAAPRRPGPRSSSDAGWRALPTDDHGRRAHEHRDDPPGGPRPARDAGPRRARPVARRAPTADRDPRPPRRLPRRRLGLLREAGRLDPRREQYPRRL